MRAWPGMMHGMRFPRLTASKPHFTEHGNHPRACVIKENVRGRACKWALFPPGHGPVPVAPEPHISELGKMASTCAHMCPGVPCHISCSCSIKKVVVRAAKSCVAQNYGGGEQGVDTIGSDLPATM
jgi:hypothetical protein